jgi:hypothetical protein
MGKAQFSDDPVMERLWDAVLKNKASAVAKELDANPGILAQHRAKSAVLLATAILVIGDKAKFSLAEPTDEVMAAMQKGRVVYDVLLRHGADVNGDPAAVSPLRQAVLTAYVPFVTELLERGADPSVAHPALGTLLHTLQTRMAKRDPAGAARDAALITLLRSKGAHN